jgi:hypothetical protein
MKLLKILNKINPAISSYPIAHEAIKERIVTFGIRLMAKFAIKTKIKITPIIYGTDKILKNRKTYKVFSLRGI